MALGLLRKDTIRDRVCGYKTTIVAVSQGRDYDLRLGRLSGRLLRPLKIFDGQSKSCRRSLKIKSIGYVGQSSRVLRARRTTAAISHRITTHVCGFLSPNTICFQFSFDPTLTFQYALSWSTPQAKDSGS